MKSKEKVIESLNELIYHDKYRKQIEIIINYDDNELEEKFNEVVKKFENYQKCVDKYIPLFNDNDFFFINNILNKEEIDSMLQINIINSYLLYVKDKTSLDDNFEYNLYLSVLSVLIEKIPNKNIYNFLLKEDSAFIILSQTLTNVNKIFDVLSTIIKKVSSHDNNCNDYINELIYDKDNSVIITCEKCGKKFVFNDRITTNELINYGISEKEAEELLEKRDFLDESILKLGGNPKELKKVFWEYMDIEKQIINHSNKFNQETLDFYGISQLPTKCFLCKEKIRQRKKC